MVYTPLHTTVRQREEQNPLERAGQQQEQGGEGRVEEDMAQENTESLDGSQEDVETDGGGETEVCVCVCVHGSGVSVCLCMCVCVCVCVLNDHLTVVNTVRVCIPVSLSQTSLFVLNGKWCEPLLIASLDVTSPLLCLMLMM